MSSQYGLSNKMKKLYLNDCDSFTSAFAGIVTDIRADLEKQTNLRIEIVASCLCWIALICRKQKRVAL
ncbi:MAG: hypothetical protein CRN43_04955 [Candidatus Nephrothrix sp. EaCA]|nr:MAG: hypothetical protein CRN43_04955 [Candidatus Nephrothrix sp. EaCA]